MKPDSFRHSPHCCHAECGSPDTASASVRTSAPHDGIPVCGQSYIVPARHGRAIIISEGQTISVTNTHGTQVCDFWAFNRNDLDEYFSMEHTRGTIGRLNPKVGDVLLTNHRRAILHFVADTSPGVHDTLIAACDVNRYKNLGFDGFHENCSDNLRKALLAIGLSVSKVPQPLNLWQNTPVGDDGTLAFRPTVSRAGDVVSFTAKMDCVVVMSACPMDLNDINGRVPVEVSFLVR